MKPGDKVMVPRTGGGTSKGEIIELYTTVEAARVKFPLDGTYQGGTGSGRHKSIIRI